MDGQGKDGKGLQGGLLGTRRGGAGGAGGRDGAGAGGIDGMPGFDAKFDPGPPIFR